MPLCEMVLFKFNIAILQPPATNFIGVGSKLSLVAWPMATPLELPLELLQLSNFVGGYKDAFYELCHLSTIEGTTPITTASVERTEKNHDLFAYDIER